MTALFGQDWLMRHRQKLLYLAAGAVNTAFGLAFYPALLLTSDWLYRNYMIALLIAQVVCTLFSFVNFKLFVFRTRGGALREFLRFSTFYYATYAVNWALLPLAVEKLQWDRIAFQLGFSIATVVIGYFWNARVTFRR